MNTTSLLELIMEYKKGNREIFMAIMEKMNPLLQSYIWKLSFMEREDAKQELLLSLLEGVQKIKYVRSEGECINYAKMCIYHTYLELVEKEQKNRAVFLEEREVPDGEDVMSCCEIMVDLERYISLLSDRKRQIATKIVKMHKNDAEISVEENISRQYVNKTRKEMQKYVENTHK